MRPVLTSLSHLSRRLPGSRTKSRAGRVVGYALTRLGAEPLVEAQTEDGVFLLDARSRTESSMLWNGSYDDDDVAFLRAVIPRDGTFLDIGANVGLVFIPVSRSLGEGAMAIGVEPVPVNYARLEAAVRSNRCAASVVLRQVALGASPGTLTLLKEGGENASGNAVAVQGGDPRPGIEVPVTTLDDLVDDLGITQLDTIKIDVEGWEVEVFRGARRTLERMRPVVYGEFNNQLMPTLGVTFEDAWEIFEPLGYEAFAFLARLHLEHRPSPPADFGNAVLVPREKVSGLMAAGVRVRR